MLTLAQSIYNANAIIIPALDLFFFCEREDSGGTGASTYLLNVAQSAHLYERSAAAW